MKPYRSPNHGHSKVKSPTYRSWLMMKNRCCNSRAVDYKYYGGRGIKVCECWHRFLNFLADMGERPAHAPTIGRVDSEKDYSPENCRWESRKEQSRARKYCRLNESKVKLAKQLYSKGWTQKRLAQKFNVGNTTMADAITGRTWK